MKVHKYHIVLRIDSFIVKIINPPLRITTADLKNLCNLKKASITKGQVHSAIWLSIPSQKLLLINRLNPVQNGPRLFLKF